MRTSAGSSGKLAVGLTVCWLAAVAGALLLTPTMFSLSKEVSSLSWWTVALVILWTVPVGPALWAAALSGPLFIAIPIREVLLYRGVITVRYRTATSSPKPPSTRSARFVTASAAPIDDDTVVSPRTRRTAGA
jgi:hypothetical protein